jgi:uncharacterized membrane protein
MKPPHASTDACDSLGTYCTLYARVLAAIIFLDFLWILVVGRWAKNVFEGVQGGRSLCLRLVALIPVYLALTYLVVQVSSVETTRRLCASKAFATGLAVYAIYDFTNLALFMDYSVVFAVADSLWGGILFLLASGCLLKQ